MNGRGIFREERWGGVKKMPGRGERSGYFVMGVRRFERERERKWERGMGLVVFAYFVVAGVEAFDYFGGDVEGGIEVNASRFE